MRLARCRARPRIGFAAALLATLPIAFTQAQPSLSDIFEQGKALGRSGNTAAHGTITEGNAQSIVPHYTSNPSQTHYFGSADLESEAASQTRACSGPTATDPSCTGVQFSQTNPARRPNIPVAPTDPLLARGRTIRADPQAIAGNLAGTYSGCATRTTSTPDRFETTICHRYRKLETATCDRVLVVTPVETPACSAGEFLTRITVDACPTCVDYYAFDFRCTTSGYAVHVVTFDKTTNELRLDLGSHDVPGRLNTQIAQTPGPSRIDATACYRSSFTQSCSGANCTIGLSLEKPCEGTTQSSASTFVMPTTVSFNDRWTNGCAALEARAQ